MLSIVGCLSAQSKVYLQYDNRFKSKFTIHLYFAIMTSDNHTIIDNQVITDNNEMTDNNLIIDNQMIIDNNN